MNVLRANSLEQQLCKYRQAELSGLPSPAAVLMSSGIAQPAAIPGKGNAERGDSGVVLPQVCSGEDKELLLEICLT